MNTLDALMESAYDVIRHLDVRDSDETWRAATGRQDVWDELVRMVYWNMPWRVSERFLEYAPLGIVFVQERGIGPNMAWVKVTREAI